MLGALLAGPGTRQLLAAATVLRIAAFAMVGVGIMIFSALGLEELTPVLGMGVTWASRGPMLH